MKAGAVQSRLNEAYGLLARAGDKDARDQLVLGNLGLVRHCAHKYGWRPEEVEEAVIGLVRAAKSYDPTLPNASAFTTYATYFIVGRVRQYRKYVRRHSAPGGELLVLDQPTVADEHGAGDALLLSRGADAPGYAEVEARDAIESALKALSEKERVVVQLRAVGLTQRQVAARLGMT